MKTNKEEQGRLNRLRGIHFEIKVFNKVKRAAKIAIHSKGSFGLFDIMAINKDGTIRLITCKNNGYLSPDERKKLLEYVEQKQSNNETVELWYYKSPRKMSRRIITADVLN